MADDFIKREDALSLKKPFPNQKGMITLYRQYFIDPEAVEQLPAADVRPVVRGQWKRVDPRSTVVTFRCSECNYYAHMNATNFCPNCGADMRETCDSDSCPIHFPDEQQKYDPDEFFSAERGGK